MPAEQAELGPVDRIFTRIGSGDDLTRGRSTFMVEMTETANILNNATANSLVLMDEVGRGTSTYDGLSLAWACAAYLAEKCGAMTLFATHYFELTQLATQIPTVENVHLDAVEHNDRIVFMHRVQEGPANRSYGLQVAALAGVPAVVLKQAATILKQLEHSNIDQNDQQLALFGAQSVESKIPQTDHPLLSRMKNLDPDSLTPREALDALYELVKLYENNKI